MQEDFEDMKRRIKEYFSTVSDEQLAVDLEEAGYSYYKKIKTPVIDVDSQAFGYVHTTTLGQAIGDGNS